MTGRGALSENVQAPRYSLHPYQEPLVTAVCEDLSAAAIPGAPLNEVVLAAAPGAGKTLMSIEVIQRLLESGRVRRVLVLAHAMTLLRTQYMEKLIEAQPRFTFADYRPKKVLGHEPFKNLLGQVIVTLPQSIATIKIGAFDLVVVDEAHLYYGKNMVSEIIERTGAKAALLLTGTPAPFVARGLKLHSVSLLELFRSVRPGSRQNFVADPMICHVQSKYEVKFRDYNNDGEIRKEVKLTGSQTRASLDVLIDWFAQFGNGQRKPWPTLLREFGKTMIVCRSQKVASAVRHYFEDLGVQVSLSTSSTDIRGTEIERFKTLGGPPLLVVVRRGSLGFDYPNLAAMIDLTGTVNIDRIFQMLCRLVRLPANPTPKLFIRMSPEGLFEYNHAVMNGALSLGDRAFYETWNGRDPGGVRVPMPREIVERGGGKGGPRGKIRMPDVRFQMFGDFFDRIVPATGDDSAYAMTSIRRIASYVDERKRERAPDVHRQEVLDYFAAYLTPVPPGHRLYGIQHTLVWKKSPRYDPDVRRAAESVGYGRKRSPALEGLTFGRWRVVGEVADSPGRRRWHVVCECGRKGIVGSTQLISGKSRSCGCLSGERLARLAATNQQKWIRGEVNKRAKLTAQAVLQMREMYAAGGVSAMECGKAFGVSGATKAKVINRTAWRHVDTPPDRFIVAPATNL